MKYRFKKLYIIILLSILAPLALYANQTLIPFALEDQFKKIHSQKELHGKKVLILAGNTDTVALHESFVNKIMQQYLKAPQKDAILVNLFDMQTVPKFLGFVVRKEFPKEKEKWVLLDWEGIFTKSYNLHPDKINVLIFNERGTLMFQSYESEATSQKAENVLHILRNQDAK